jgi:hypothetical protein
MVAKVQTDLDRRNTGRNRRIIGKKLVNEREILCKISNFVSHDRL